MPRRKRSSKAIDHAERRFSVLNTLDPATDLGNGMTVGDYGKQIEKTRNSLGDYNTSLTTIDQNMTDLKAEEKDLEKMTRDILTLVEMREGKKSDLYQQLSSVRKNPPKKKRSTATEDAGTGIEPEAKSGSGQGSSQDAKPESGQEPTAA